MEVVKSSLLSLTATEMAKQIKAGEISSSELVEAHIARIEQINPSINAMVVQFFDESRAAAIAADEEIRAGQEVGPLHGVPVSIKEFFDVRGALTTAGIQSVLGVTTGASISPGVVIYDTVAPSSADLVAFGVSTSAPAVAPPMTATQCFAFSLLIGRILADPAGCGRRALRPPAPRRAARRSRRSRPAAAR